MESKVLYEQNFLKEDRFYNEKKPVTELPIEGIKNPIKDHDIIIGSPFEVAGENHGHGNNKEGIDISNPGGAFSFELTSVVTDIENPFEATGADVGLLQMALADPLA